jgi:glycosyltransferase involved in cell wall biosynthesis
MPEDTYSPPMNDLEVRKGLGRAYLNANRFEAALETYTCILQDYPQDAESYVILGDCYLAEGSGGAAARLYARALQLAPADAGIARRLDLARAEASAARASGTQASGAQASGAQASGADSEEEIPEAIARLVQGPAAPGQGGAGDAGASGPAMSVSEAEVIQAAAFLRAVIGSPNPALEVEERLGEIEGVLPGLLELNIRQARADGQPDLALALQNLLAEICPRLETGSGASASHGSDPDRPPPESLRLLFLAPRSEETAEGGSAGVQPGMPPRLALAAGALEAIGCQVKMADRFPAGALSEFDAVIAHRPHCDPNMMEGLAACSASGLPILLDIDVDYEQLPLNDPRYDTQGLGTLVRGKAYIAALLLAERITVPSLPLAASLQAAGYAVQVIPDGWSQDNELWEKPPPRRHTLNLGWVGNPGQIEDITTIRRIIVRVLREFPHTRLVISGDPQVYQFFDSVPESRRLFLPPASYEDYPYLLGQVDILLAPLRNIPFNRSISDRWLIEAGARGIPWIASPIPAAIAWGAGGLLADRLDEWHTHLRQLILDEELRAALARGGRAQAAGREMGRLGNLWLETIYSVIGCRLKVAS